MRAAFEAVFGGAMFRGSTEGNCNSPHISIPQAPVNRVTASLRGWARVCDARPSDASPGLPRISAVGGLRVPTVFMAERRHLVVQTRTACLRHAGHAAVMKLKAGPQFCREDSYTVKCLFQALIRAL